MLSVRLIAGLGNPSVALEKRLHPGAEEPAYHSRKDNRNEPYDNRPNVGENLDEGPDYPPVKRTDAFEKIAPFLFFNLVDKIDGGVIVLEREDKLLVF
jgi:hypothetical protein